MWFRVDDKLWGSPKWLALKPSARALWVTAGSYSMDQLTDGFIPDHVIAILGGKDADCVALVKANLWEKDAGGFRFHDWSDYQPSRASILDKRDQEAQRKAAWRAKRAGQRAASADGPADVPPGHERDKCVSPTIVPDVSRSSRPDPTRPDPTVLPTEVQEGGAGGTLPDPDGSDATPQKSSRRKPERPLPESWAPNAKHYQQAEAKGVDLTAQARAFRNHAATHDRRARDWDAAFRTWLDKAKPGTGTSTGRSPWDIAPKVGGE